MIVGLENQHTDMVSPELKGREVHSHAYDQVRDVAKQALGILMGPNQCTWGHEIEKQKNLIRTVHLLQIKIRGSGISTNGLTSLKA
jgi:hypothetical protein